MEWFIKHTDLLQSDGTVLTDQNVLIRDDLVVAIEPASAMASIQAERVTDASGMLMIPGLINAHFHSHDRFDRGRFDNLPLELWMAAYNTPLGRREWTPEDCYLRTALTCLEQIENGVTTVIDDVFHGDLTSEENIEAVYQAYEDSGLRAMVTIAFSDLPYHKTIPFGDRFIPESLKKELNDKLVDPDVVLRLWRKFAARYQGRVSFAVSTSGPQRCSDEFQQKAWHLARDLDLPVFTHTLETKTQELTGYLHYGIRTVEHMYQLGLLSPRTKLVHSVWLDDKDIERIAETGAMVIHNPISNLKLGSGIAPISKLMAAGIPVGIGTDNCNCNDSVNLIEAMKTAALISKVNTGHYETWIGAEEALAMATQGGAACYGHSGIGVLKSGSKADFTLFNLDASSFFPNHNRLYQLVYSENGKAIDTVVVDGKPVLEKGMVTSLDRASIKERLDKRHDRILSMIAESSKRADELLPYLKQSYDLCLGLAETTGLNRS